VYEKRKEAVIRMVVKVNLGCGSTPFKGWINIDKSWNVRLYRLPLIKKLAIRFLSSFGLVAKESLKYVVDYPPNVDVRGCDITKGLPFDDLSVDYIYTSQMLEHLRREDAIFVLKECHRVLKPGGVLHVVVPDLRLLTNEYICSEGFSDDKDLSVADKFMDALMLHNIGDPRPLFEKLISKRHQWMYDFQSLAKRLYDCGFSKVEERKVGEGLIPDIQHLEREYHIVHSPISVFLEAIK